MFGIKKLEILLLIIIFILAYCSYSNASAIAFTYKSDYDIYFKKYTKRFFGVGYDWHWFKAQGIAESNLNPYAESYVGAKGIMQLMPNTHDEIKKELGIPDAIYSPRWNIAGGIYYDRKMYNKWISPRPEEDKRNLMFASYNAGFGRVLNAQKKCISNIKTNCNLWFNIEPFCPGETRTYVKRINTYMGKEYDKSN